MFRSGRRLGLAVAGVVLTAVVVLAALWVAWRDPAQDLSASDEDVAGSVPVGLPEPSPEPVVPPADEVANDPPAETAGGAVDVVLTYAAWERSTDAVEVSGFVSGVVEIGGTCRLALTLGQRSAVVERPAEPDASTTVCGTLSVPRDDLSEGTWQAVLSYESATSSGVSAPSDVEVPAR